MVLGRGKPRRRKKQRKKFSEVIAVFLWFIKGAFCEVEMAGDSFQKSWQRCVDRVWLRVYIPVRG